MSQTIKSYRICEQCWIRISKAWEAKLNKYAAEGRQDIEPPPKFIEINEEYRLRVCDHCQGETIGNRFTTTPPEASA